MKHDPNVIIGFDFGTKYIGVAIGQRISHTSTPITSLLVKNGSIPWHEITELITSWQPGHIVVGIPLNMDDTKQQLTFLAQNFADNLHARYRLPMHTVDERLSTWEAKQRLGITQHSLKKNLSKINATAAAILVEQWLGTNTHAS